MIKKIVISLALLVVIACVGVGTWMSVPFPYQQDVAEKALVSDADMHVLSEPWLQFQPSEGNPTTGLIFYPGGKTPASVFAPLMREIAANGYLTVSVPMPLNTAFLGIDKAQEVINANPEVQRWVIAGHSLGGVGASEYVKQADEKVKGLLLYASYPASDISGLTIEVLSIYGSADQQSTPEKIKSYQDLLPSTAQYREIQGADHWQFGAYQPSLSAGVATISHQAQQSAIMRATLEFLASIEG
ncbi:alpha/beta hydrolase [Thalassotalea mangrovi]|uniref:Alpha/beta hydrolase n=1 Tax=Thalassotalea mangrovi TaxID=2572245 RepID=A0A4U1B6H9_9GAMM|nr:alpha/beta hydrolase [Thalassotalea mangrovi]TKB46050.1 alpha/beta hydrolase [Thalassotalea mangrovi]